MKGVESYIDSLQGWEREREREIERQRKRWREMRAFCKIYKIGRRFYASKYKS